MAYNPNNAVGTEYVNTNICRSFNQNIGTSMTRLTGAEVPGLTNTSSPVLTGGMVCSEVTIINKTTGNLSLYDRGFDDTLNGLLIGTGESITLRGLTNVAQVSAVAAVAGNVYYRTQFYSNNPSR